MAKQVLIVYHSLSGNTEAAAQAVAGGVGSVQDVQAVVKHAADATLEDLVSCDAICVGTPDYFTYMAGMLKDFFDRTYYPSQGKVDAKPCGIFVTHGGGGGASESVEKVCKSFRFTQVGSTLLVKGRPDEAAQTELHALGAAVAKAAL